MFKLILVCLAAVFAMSEAQIIGGGIGGVPVGAGIGGGIGGVGVPVVAGRVFVARPVVIRPVVARPVFVGKREVVEPIANVTECVLSSESNKLICEGIEKLSCDLSSNFAGLGNFSFIVKDLALHKFDKEIIDKVDVDRKESELEHANIEKVEITSEVKSHIEPIFQFLAEEIIDHKIVAAKHTFVNPLDNKPVILSLYWNEKLSEKCLGFRVKEHTCWEKFEQLVEKSKPEQLEFQLVMSQIEA